MKVGVGAEGGNGEVDREGKVDDDRDDDDGLDGGDGEAGEGGRRSLLALFSFSGSSTSLVFEAAERLLIQLRATTNLLSSLRVTEPRSALRSQPYTRHPQAERVVISFTEPSRLLPRRP